jgi:hypothetical protein
MRRFAECVAAVLVVAGFAVADDQQKAEKQIRMMTAMSRDDTARSIISRTFADQFKMQRLDLVTQRRALGLNYGSLFVAHELLQSGAPLEQIVVQLRARKNILEVGNASHVNWKRIADDAKKMNKHINDSIYKHFLHSKSDEERDKLEHYNPSFDLVRADSDATPDEIAKAQQEYVFWRNLAAPISDNPADRSSPTAHSYEQRREDIAVTHGDTPPGPR